MNLTTCLEKYPTLPEYIESSILLDVATGLEFLHTKHPPIMHRDLTSNNVLLTSNMVAKISDLGQAKLFDLKCASKYSTAPGNPCHMPPEALVSEPKYTPKIDIFSFGVIIVHVATHSWPFPATTLDKKTHQVQIATEIDKRKEHFEKMDGNSLLTKLAKRCLQDDPDQRPDAAYLIQEIAQSKPDPPFSNTLEMQLALDAMSRKCQHLEQHIQNIDLQMNAIQDDFEWNPSSHLQKIVAANKSALANACSDNLIVGYHLPTHHTRSSSDIQLTLMKSATASKHTCTMELIVRAPLSTHFTGTLVRSIGSITSPWGLAITKEGQVFIVQNCGWKGVLLYDCLGKKLGEYVPSLSKRNFSSPKGSCYYPKGVAIDKDGNFILVDTRCNRIQKFKLNPDLQKEEFVKSAGEHGNGDKQFNRPTGIRERNGKFYVCDKNNSRIQILDEQLEFMRSFGKEGDGPSDFLYPRDIDFDSQGRIYIVDCGHYVIKVFSPTWAYVGKFGGEGHGRGTFEKITSICIDKHDYIYVTDKAWNCVQVFDPRWQFVMQINLPRLYQKSTSQPVGIAVDDHGYVYVSCEASGCIHVYK